LISGDNMSRIFEIAAGCQVTFSNLDLTAGNGVANNPNGNMTFNNGYGGAILNFGTLIVNGCTLTNNFASKFGGAIFSIEGSFTIENSYLTNNSAAFGPAIAGESAAASYVTGCTLTGNHGSPAIFNGEASITLKSDTFSGNPQGDTTPDEPGEVLNGGGNTGITSYYSKSPCAIRQHCPRPLPACCLLPKFRRGQI
jgi:hypothetical protein